jgi:hypothetical protein
VDTVVLCAAHFGEGEQEGECRLHAFILVHPVDMPAIPATTTLSIIERETEIVAPVKPFEGFAWTGRLAKTPLV